MRTILFICIITASVFANSIKGFIEPEGNTNWNADTVLLDKSLTFSADDTLTVEEGTTIITELDHFDDPITIEGVLNINGTPSRPVKFEFSPEHFSDTLGVSFLLTGSAEAYVSGLIVRSQRPDEAVFSLTDSSKMELRDCELDNNSELFRLNNFSSVSIRKSSFTDNISIDGLIIFERGDSISVAVDSCTFTNNRNASEGGIFVSTYSSTEYLLTLSNCIFENNTAGAIGGVMYLKSDGTLDITNCYFSGNRVTQAAGVMLVDGFSSSVSISDSFFEDNGAYYYGQGSCGAFMIIAPSGNVTITNSYFGENKSGHSTGCGYIHSQTISIIQTVLYKNGSDRGSLDGGGLFIAEPSNLLIANSTFALNSTSGGVGGGLYIRDAAPGNNRVVNTIFADNSADYGSQIVLENTNNTVFKNCYISSGSSDIYYYNSFNNEQNFRNIVNSGDLFNDIEQGDLSLVANSPCVNGGIADTSGLKLPSQDFSGQVNRITGGIIDIGAYEYPTSMAVKQNRIQPELFNISPSAPAELSICTMQGKTAHREINIIALPESLESLVPHSLGAGFYLIRLKTFDGAQIVRNLVKY